MTTPITWLFVPGDRPERFAKAASSGADAVILDLEDAVAPTRKASARAATADWLVSRPGWVRINAIGTPQHTADIQRLADPALRHLQGIVVPMAEDPDTLASVHATVGCKIVALVETALGLHRATALAEAEGVTRLAFGSIDYALDIDALESREALLLARSTLVAASRLAGLPSPVDGVSVDATNPNVVADDARYARGLGFGGKLCIHPAQVVPVATAFTPTEADLAWARSVLAAAGSGAVSVDGMMVDEPVLARARRILEDAP
ncbi:CoA ester lyase [Aeromicrobium sp. YIM 150415]|uniref:HpcH/HpaI aldolase/citrate lyase family protein n=1 Tax=Aeromicrobium sp. YIM 150415 TaxID=2803912 RepID=UPI0027DC512C|nr:CoA ester lyase [Aeromicrobium sp. YIM 150415]